MSEKQTIKLKYPIPVKNDDGSIIEIDTISIGRLKLKHLKSLPSDFSEMEKGKLSVLIPALIPVIAGLANIPIESAEEIDFEDIEQIMDCVSSFLARSPKTGVK